MIWGRSRSQTCFVGLGLLPCPGRISWHRRYGRKSASLVGKIRHPLVGIGVNLRIGERPKSPSADGDAIWPRRARPWATGCATAVASEKADCLRSRPITRGAPPTKWRKILHHSDTAALENPICRKVHCESGRPCVTLPHAIRKGITMTTTINLPPEITGTAICAKPR